MFLNVKRILNEPSMDCSPSVKKKKVQRRWSSNEEDDIIQYFLNTMKEGKMIEKPTCDIYYAKMLVHLNIPDCGISQLKNKVRNMKKLYSDTVVWRNQIGQGVRETDGEETFTALTLKKCPYFVSMEEIFGTTLNLQPPCVMTSYFSMGQTFPQDMLDTTLQLDIPQVTVSEDNFTNENALQLDEEIVTVPESPGSSSLHNPKKDLEKVPVKTELKKESGGRGGVALLAEARNKKTDLDMKRLDLANSKFEFEKEKFELEKEKFQFEKEKFGRELKLEELRIENQYKISRYELELKYGIKNNAS